MLISTASTADTCGAWEKIGQGVAEDVGSKEIEGRFVPRSIGPSRMLTLNAQIQRRYILAGQSFTELFILNNMRAEFSVLL